MHVQSICTKRNITANVEGMVITQDHMHAEIFAIPVNVLIDLTDYSCLPNGWLVSMFAPFSLTSARKGYAPTFSARICLLLSLNSIISLYF